MLATKPLKNNLTVFLTCVIFLSIVGMVFIYSASSVFALEKVGTAHYFLKKHIIGCILGLIAAITIQPLPVWLLKKMSPYFFILSLVLTSLTLFPSLALRVHGSSRWLALPFISFQPSELLKMSLILYCAYFLSKKEKSSYSFFFDYLPLLFILGLTSFILLAQPDFGLTATLLATVLCMTFIFGNFNAYLGYTLLAIIPMVIFLIYSRSYRLKRILTFLDPWSDAQGAGFQIIQSLIALGSGGLFGVGIGRSNQKFFYLPMQHTDFIFSIIAEETGFVGSLFIIVLYLTFLYSGLRLAAQMRDLFSFLTIVGYVLVISLQAFINICVTTGLAPTKGIGLPFISYGNSALICQFMMIGIIVSLVHHNRSLKIVHTPSF